LLKLSLRKVHCIRIKHELYKLLHEHLSSFHWLDLLFGLRCGFLLRNDWSICCNRDMRDRKVFVFLGDLVHKLWSGVLSGLHWHFCVLFMLCRLVLCRHRPDSRDRSVRCGIILCSFIDYVLKLYCWNLCFCAFVDQLLKLSRRKLHCISIEHKLHELLHWFLSGINRLDSLFGLRCRFLLRNDGSIGCNRDMRDRKVFVFLGDLVYKLWSGILSGLNWLNGLLCMLRRFVLCHHRTYSCNRSVRCGIILFILSVHMLELSRWNLRCLVFKYKLLKLSVGKFSNIDRLHYMLELYRWIVLCNHRFIIRDRSVRCGILLSVFIDNLFKLSRWNICCFVFDIKLFKLSRGDLPSINWRNGLLSL